MSFEYLRAGTVFLEPLYPGKFERILPDSGCIANAYPNNHDALAEKDIASACGEGGAARPKQPNKACSIKAVHLRHVSERYWFTEGC